jgi:sugar lactone lactonase YvrE
LRLDCGVFLEVAVSRIVFALWGCLWLALLLAAPLHAAPRAEVVIDASGDGTHGLKGPRGVAIDGAGNLYVVGMKSHNAFRVSPDGQVTQIIDGSGDGRGNRFVSPRSIAVDPAGNVFVAGEKSDTVFRISPGGEIRLVLDASGGGTGAPMDHPSHITVDAAGNVYVASQLSYTVHKVTPEGEVTVLVDGKREDLGYEMRRPNGIAVDAAGNVFAVGAKSNNALRVAPDGTVAEVVDRLGARDGHGLHFPNGAAVDAAGNLYICGNNSANVIRVRPTGEVVQLAPPALRGEALAGCGSVTARADGTVYFTRFDRNSLWRIAPDGRLDLVLPKDEGWGARGRINAPRALTVDGEGNLYVSGFGSDAVFRIGAEELLDAPGGSKTDGMTQTGGEFGR